MNPSDVSEHVFIWQELFATFPANVFSCWLMDSLLMVIQSPSISKVFTTGVTQMPVDLSHNSLLDCLLAEGAIPVYVVIMFPQFTLVWEHTHTQRTDADWVRVGTCSIFIWIGISTWSHFMWFWWSLIFALCLFHCLQQKTLCVMQSFKKHGLKT